MIGSPDAPVDTPLLWVLMGWARREFEQTTFNLTAAPGVQQLSSLTVDPPGSAAAADAVLSPNLLVNADAEYGDPSLSGYSSVTVPGWTVTGTPTVIQYGTLRRFPSPFAFPGPTFPAFLGFPSARSAPPGSGMQFFGGGPVATSTLTQTSTSVPPRPRSTQGDVPYELSGDLGGFLIDPSGGLGHRRFLDSNGAILGTGTIGAGHWPRSLVPDRVYPPRHLRDDSGGHPQRDSGRDLNGPQPGTRQLQQRLRRQPLVHGSALHCPPPPPPTPPVSTVGRLDHVFMVYMENKGFTEIVGSPNAPYLNSLINTYGFGTNYFGLTHPSDPNYYPIIGGSDFGFNWNCPADCFDAPNSGRQRRGSGLDIGPATRRAEAATTIPPTDYRSLPSVTSITIPTASSHTYSISRRWEWISHNPATAPNYVWFAANDEFNMEGPTDFPFGMLHVGYRLPRPASSVQRRGGRRVALGARARHHELGHLAGPQRREAPSSSRSTRTTTTFHWASATKATTSSWSSSRHRGL